MTYVFLWSPRWATAAAPLGDLAASLLELVPRVAVYGEGRVWADARGLPAPKLAWSLLERAGGVAEEIRAGVSGVAVAAELAARSGDGPVTLVEAGYERAFLAPLPLELLDPHPRLRTLLEGVGVVTCGELAALPREAVEVRFGAAGTALWRLARADDPRRLFRPIPRERPQASMDFVDHTITDATRLVFTVNALLGSVCETLAARAQRARSITLTLPLSGGGTVRERVRAARATADRGFWVRRLQAVLDRLRLPGGAIGVSLEVEETEPVSAMQGDLFDRGFGTAAAVEEAVARLLEEQEMVLVAPEVCDHPLAERRTRWVARPALGAADAPSPTSLPVPTLSLHLLQEPRPVAVRIRMERLRPVPVSYLHAGAWTGVATASGPDRVSGGRWEEQTYARDYFRCVTEEGALVWIFRDVEENRWYIHGWWD